ncbi:hypothetical protein B0H13DRAFT_2046409 [Mycena leptocephala]|nr:hypothetical protein B0H13DRAFT_2046409 [Mycena leptocephala]
MYRMTSLSLPLIVFACRGASQLEVQVEAQLEKEGVSHKSNDAGTRNTPHSQSPRRRPSSPPVRAPVIEYRLGEESEDGGLDECGCTP